MHKLLDVVEIPPPPEGERVSRQAELAKDTERPSRYHLPRQLFSCSPVGYRRRLSMTAAEVDAALVLLALPRPPAFVRGPIVSEQALFEETSLGVLTSRQSSNFR